MGIFLEHVAAFLHTPAAADGVLVFSSAKLAALDFFDAWKFQHRDDTPAQVVVEDVPGATAQVSSSQLDAMLGRFRSRNDILLRIAHELRDIRSIKAAALSAVSPVLAPSLVTPSAQTAPALEAQVLRTLVALASDVQNRSYVHVFLVVDPIPENPHILITI
jgi:hypothetical protein